MFKALLTLFLLTLLSNSSFATSVVIKDVKKLTDVEKAINGYPGKGEILVVFDIDDTLLESVSFVGGDTWYNWQRGKDIESTQGGELNIADSDKFSCLFSKLGTFYELGLYHPSEKNAPEIVAQIQSKYDLMALTSRSPDYRGGTVREMKKAGYHLASAHLMEAGHALAYQFNDGRSTRGVTYQNGIVMSTGLNKGEVLIDLLEKIGKSYEAIFFIDDSQKNIDNMEKAWADASTLVKIFHYTGVDKRISPADITQSREARVHFNHFLSAAFPNRATSFSEGNCQ